MRQILFTPLHLAARHGRLCLVLGLLAGLGLPDLAVILQPWLPELVALLICVSAFRIGPRAALGGLRDLRGTAITLALYQVAAPMTALTLFALFGLAATPVALAVVLMLTAPSVTGSPNFAILMGFDPAPALRLLILGTTIFPVTSLLVLWLLPGLEDVSVIAAASRLLLTIAVATSVAFALRHWAAPDLGADGQKAVDGTSALLLAIVVVGLMSALGPALAEDPILVLGWLAVAVGANLGMQVLAFAIMGRRAEAVPVSIVAGNRNIALFLVALPPDQVLPLLIFIGCYQVPMYLTPIVMTPLYRRART